MNIAWNKLKKQYVRPNLDAPLAQHQGGYEPLAHAKRGDMKDKHLTYTQAQTRAADRRLNPGTMRSGKHSGMSGGHGVEGQQLQGVGQEQSFSTHGTGESVFDTPSFVHQGQNPESLHPTQEASKQMQQKKKQSVDDLMRIRGPPPPNQNPSAPIATGYPMATNAAWSIIKGSVCKNDECATKGKSKDETCEKLGCA